MAAVIRIAYPLDVANAVTEIAREIRSIEGRVLSDFLAIGERLLKARDLLRGNYAEGDHEGEWRSFLKRVEIAEVQARRLIQVYERYGGGAAGGAPPTSFTVLAELAAPGTDPLVVKAIESKISTGEKVTKWDVIKAKLDAKRGVPVVVPKKVEQSTVPEVQTTKKTKAPRGFSAAILERFADGKWHTFKSIVDGVGASESYVENFLHSVRFKGTFNSRCERRRVGTGASYRIIRHDGRLVPLSVLMQELRPILEELKVEGKKSIVTACPAAVAELVLRLERLIEGLAK